MVFVQLILWLLYALLDVFVSQAAWNMILAHYVPTIPQISFGQAALIGVVFTAFAFPPHVIIELGDLKKKVFGKLSNKEGTANAVASIFSLLIRLALVYTIGKNL